MKKALNNDQQRRKFVLEDNVWKVVFTIAFPLVLHSSAQKIFQLLDTLIASNMSAQVISTVSYVNQIQSMLGAIGVGLGGGAGIVIARHFGSGKMEEVKRNINSVFLVALVLSAFLLFLVIPLSIPFLSLFGVPEDLLTSEAKLYFGFSAASLIFVFINTIYFSIEKAKAKTKNIFFYNIWILSIKFLLTIIFVFVIKKGIIWLSVASLIAHASLSVYALKDLIRKNNPLGIDLSINNFSFEVLKPILILAVPIFLERFIFAYGKVLVNSMGAIYGSFAIGALGISNRLGGIGVTLPRGFARAESDLVSQNIGNKNIDRAIGIFKRVFFINVVIGIIVFLLMTVFQDFIINAFSKGNAAFAMEIRNIYTYERYATVFLAASTSVMSLLYGFGKTKIAMILNIIRLFLFRIPSLWIIQNYTNLGSEGLGIAMMVSNLLTGIAATCVAIVFIYKVRKKPLSYLN